MGRVKSMGKRSRGRILYRFGLWTVVVLRDGQKRTREGRSAKNYFHNSE